MRGIIMARRKKVKKSTIVKIVVISTVLTAAAAVGIVYLRKYVSTKFADEKQKYLSAQASVSDLSTRVSGTGSLTDSDTEEYEIPENVDIDEVVVEVGFWKIDEVAVGLEQEQVSIAAVGLHQNPSAQFLGHDRGGHVPQPARE